MTTHESCAETVLLGDEMGGDERKDVQLNAIDGKEGVPPLANIRQRRRDILVELRNVVKGEAIVGVNASFFRISQAPSLERCFETYNGEYELRFSSSFRAKASCESDRPFPG